MILYKNKKLTIPSGINPNINQFGGADVHNQEKNVRFTRNGSFTVKPDSGYTGLNPVNVTVDVAAGTAQSKNVTIIENGTTLVTPDEGFEALDKVRVNVSVDTVTPYFEGKADGIAEQKAKLDSSTFTKNGTYTREDGWNQITVDVPVASTYYANLSKIYDYLYDTTYINLDYDYAYDYFKSRGPELNIGGCTSVRNGHFYGRNLDWLYSNQVDFIVRTEDTIGIAGSVSDLTKNVVENDKFNEAYHIMPFFLQDGVNKHGVFANINVVNIDSSFGTTTYSEPLVSKVDEVCAIMLVRYILDKFESAQEAVEYIRDYVSIFFPVSLQEQGYECHWMVGDRTKTYAIEIINDRVNIIETNILSNFYLTGFTPNEDGTAYSIIDVPTHIPSVENGLRPLASGVERYNIAVKGIQNGYSMRTIMNSLLYTNTYTLQQGDDFWYSEYVSGELGIDNSVAEYDTDGRINRIIAQYQTRDRNNPVTWHTTHSCVYDLNELTLNIISQESNSYDTVITKTYEEGFDDGAAYQKSKLTTTRISANGTYTREDGWNAVVVDTPTLPPTQVLKYIETDGRCCFVLDDDLQLTDNIWNFTIEYSFDNLDSIKGHPWNPEDARTAYPVFGNMAYINNKYIGRGLCFDSWDLQEIPYDSYGWRIAILAGSTLNEDGSQSYTYGTSTFTRPYLTGTNPAQIHTLGIQIYPGLTPYVHLEGAMGTPKFGYMGHTNISGSVLMSADGYNVCEGDSRFSLFSFITNIDDPVYGHIWVPYAYCPSGLRIHRFSCFKESFPYKQIEYVPALDNNQEPCFAKYVTLEHGSEPTFEKYIYNTGEGIPSYGLQAY